MHRIAFAELAAFIAVAEHLSFRVAASRLDVSPSALSHTMRQLEERVGVRLLHRTTRSVALTDAGRRLLERLRPAIDEIDGALEDLDQGRDQPAGACGSTSPIRRWRRSRRSGRATSRPTRRSSSSSRWTRRPSTSRQRDSTPASGRATMPRRT